jgi:copper transport protein
VIALVLQAPAAEPLLSGLDVVMEYIGFVSYFLVFGALGLRFAALRGLEEEGGAAPSVAAAALRGAATLGATGALLMLARQLFNTAMSGAEDGKTLIEAATQGGLRFAIPFFCAVALALAFGLARGGVQAAWKLAALAGVVLALRGVTTGRWFSLVNPLHEVAASLWLGTLLLLVTVGFPAVMRLASPGEERGRLVARLVTRFSPLALGAAGLLVVSGVITALRHLNPFSSLWSTPYGYALCAKLACVLVVVALGAWNWRRVTPRLGDEAGARSMQRSSRNELMAAALVLLATAVLVSLPSPRPPRPAGSPAERPAGAPAAPGAPG